MTRDEGCSLIGLYTEIIGGYLEVALREQKNEEYEQLELTLKAMQNNLAKFKKIKLKDELEKKVVSSILEYTTDSEDI